jgi:hypothetical protein
MKKSDIKNGMHVITNNGNEYIIISGIEAYKQIEDTNTANTVMIQLDGSGWMPFDDYDDDLCYHDPEGDECDIDRYYDIKAVYTPQYYSWTLLSVYDKSCISDKFIKVWERPRKKMTKAEIETELGYEIEIVESED